MKRENTILIVDDAPINITLINGLLKDKYKTKIATNGEKALKIAFSDTPPDLILLDIIMPEMDGYEVCRRLKADDKVADIPIIFLTSKTETEDIVKGFEVGGVDYITKPFNASELFARVSTQLNLRKATREKQELLVKLNEELNEAADYIKSLLPAPILEGDCLTDWRFIPCTSLGGDSFGYHWLDSDRFAVYLIDVSGHGVGAALMSISVINILRSETLPGTDFKDPSQVLKALNNSFPMEDHNDMYFTIWYGVYDNSSGNLKYASAGHPPAVLFENISETGDGRIVELQTENLVVGALPDRSFNHGEYSIAPPGRLYLFSDGVFEIPIGDDDRWDYEDFIDFISLPLEAGTGKLNQLWNYVQELKGEELLDDDYSILEVTFK